MVQMQAKLTRADTQYASDIAARDERFRHLEAAVQSMAANQAAAESEVLRLQSCLAAKLASEAAGMAEEAQEEDDCSSVSSSSDGAGSDRIGIQEAVTDAIAHEEQKRTQMEEYYVHLVEDLRRQVQQLSDHGIEAAPAPVTCAVTRAATNTRTLAPVLCSRSLYNPKGTTITM